MRDKPLQRAHHVMQMDDCSSISPLFSSQRYSSRLGCETENELSFLLSWADITGTYALVKRNDFQTIIHTRKFDESVDKVHQLILRYMSLTWRKKRRVEAIIIRDNKHGTASDEFVG